MVASKNRKVIIDDIVPPTEPMPIIPQETVKLPRRIPKTDLPENFDYISAISDINKISYPNQFDNVDGDDIDFNVVEQIPDNDDDVIYIKYIPPPPPEMPVSPPIHPTKDANKN